MATDFTPLTWRAALGEFLLHLEAIRSASTRCFYSVQVGQLATWAEENDVAFAAFGKRHLDRFLAGRAKAGRSQRTLHHDAICAKAFYR
jgi:site-specific recombinase XerD